MVSKEITDRTFSRFAKYLESKTGIVLANSKRYLVRSRLSSLLQEQMLDNMDDLIELVIKEKNSAVTRAAINAMTTNETMWFRDNHPFEVLKSTIFPRLCEKRTPIKVWSAACSSGQEPFSIVITYEEWAAKNSLAKVPLSIIATDLSTKMIEHCKTGIFDKLALTRGGLTEERKRKFFETVGDGKLRATQQLQNPIRFQEQNLLTDRPPSTSFDIIFCRNVLIYFSAEVKVKILQQFAASLNEGGILFLGASESLGAAADKFTLQRCNPGIYYQLK